MRLLCFHGVIHNSKNEKRGGNMNINIVVEEIGATIQVFVSGEIDAFTAPQLREMVMPYAQRESISLIVDISDVSFIDSTGLGVIVALFKSVRVHDGHFEIVGLSNRIKRLFEITGLINIIDINSETKGGVQ